MKKILLLTLFTLIFSSCITNNYFLSEIDNGGIDIYSERGLVNIYKRIPEGKRILIIGNTRRIKYGKHIGYIKNTSFRDQIKLTKDQLKNWIFDDELGTYLTKEDYKAAHFKSSSDSSSDKVYSDRTVHVKGYYRKNGTYVRSHTRSAPSHRR